METIKQVTLLVEKLQNDWYRALGSDKITRIDKDILVQDIRQLYDLVYELEIGSVISNDQTDRVLKDQPESKNPEIPKTANVEPAQMEPTSEDQDEISEPTPEVVKEPEKLQDPNEVELEVIAETEPVVTLESDVENEEVDETREDKSGIPDTDFPAETAKPSAAEKFTASKTLADIYRANGDNSIAAKMQSNKISDLKTAIGINEKFLFINEIFNGKTDSYKKAIEAINKMNHNHEALEYLEQIRQENRVNSEDALSAFVEILKRKFQ